MAGGPRCPTCRRPVAWHGNPNRPFCSERCRLVDLGNWLGERYRIAGESGTAATVPEAARGGPADGEDDSPYGA